MSINVYILSICCLHIVYKCLQIVYILQILSFCVPFSMEIKSFTVYLSNVLCTLAFVLVEVSAFSSETQLIKCLSDYREEKNTCTDSCSDDICEIKCKDIAKKFLRSCAAYDEEWRRGLISCFDTNVNCGDKCETEGCFKSCNESFFQCELQTGSTKENRDDDDFDIDDSDVEEEIETNSQESL